MEQKQGLYDVIVAGGGVQGLSTARYLAKLNVKTLLIDQFAVPHTRGSSHGKSRNIRYTYDKQHYCDMMPEAYRLWSELEKECGQTLLTKIGIFCLRSDKLLMEMAASLKKLNIPYEFLTGEDGEKKFPGFKTGKFNGIYEQQAGVLNADKCVCSLLESFQKLGGTFKQETLCSVNPIEENLVQITTSKGKHFAKSLILTCGPWTNKVLKPLGLCLPITISYHHGVEINSPEEAFKPLNEEQSALEKSQISLLKKYITEHYPDVIATEPSSIQPCFYSMTPDEDFILDRHPRYENIIIGAGFSGHGFKMAPVIGSLLGDLALNRKTKYSLGPFSIKRFKDKEELISSIENN
ncbi:peroxisomal sarcosine oxidase-like isoform X2 [Clavelina lepadiformis]|uniref:peroxisomal sarcosine oxidase-like isoform X2 n=1 Tax=Clavelina lepadiformis TaxID=159417 RepID=UPI0040437C9F